MFADALHQLVNDYVKTGKVQVVFKQFAFLGPESVLAAQASECAFEQGKFWEYHDILFANQRAFSSASLKNYAAKLGLDAAAFASCLDSGRTAAEVQRDTNEGRARGVRATPTFFIGDKKYEGAYPPQQLRALFDAALR